MVAIPAPDTAKETRATARADIDRRVESLLNSLDADTPDNPTAKNFGQQEVANLREYVKRATQEGLPTLTSSQMGELLAQAAEGKNIKPLDPKAEIRPDDIRIADTTAAPQSTGMANAIVTLGAPGSMRSSAVAASASVGDDPFALGKPPATPDMPQREQELAR